MLATFLLPLLAGLWHATATADGPPAASSPCMQTFTIAHPSYNDTWRAGALDNRLALFLSPPCDAVPQVLRLFNLDNSLAGDEWTLRFVSKREHEEALVGIDTRVLLPPQIPAKKGYYLALTAVGSTAIIHSNVSHEFEVERDRTGLAALDLLSLAVGGATVVIITVAVWAVLYAIRWKRWRGIALPLDEDADVVPAGEAVERQQPQDV